MDLVAHIAKLETPISVGVLEATRSPNGHTVTSLEVYMPRIILAEFNTHRVFSRNVSSSRAIPWKKMVAKLKQQYFTPAYWGANESGMQATAEITGIQLKRAKFWWWLGAKLVFFISGRLAANNLHKQLANRWLEPIMYVKAVVSATEWENFLALRMEAGAQPEIIDLAIKTDKALDHADSFRRILSYDASHPDGWHLPYITTLERRTKTLAEVLIMSVARCARTSFMPLDGVVHSFAKDKVTFSKLLLSKPEHSSPAEHQVCPLRHGEQQLGNLKGFKQLRHMDLRLTLLDQVGKQP